MSLISLEAAALSPYAFVSRLWKKLPIDKHIPMMPVATRIFNPRCSESVKLVNLELIPGGRFLLTVNSKDFIQLWDLGYSLNTVISTKPLASIKVSGVIDLRTQPTLDGTGIRVLIYSSSPAM